MEFPLERADEVSAMEMAILLMTNRRCVWDDEDMFKKSKQVTEGNKMCYWRQNS